MKLFVARLPQSATAETLRSLFETLGEVKESKVIFDRDTGNSKGYAFVEMESAEAAQTAIEKLNGYHLDGKDILVKVSDPAPDNTTGQQKFRNPSPRSWDMQKRSDRFSLPFPQNDHHHSENREDNTKNLRPRRKRIQP